MSIRTKYKLLLLFCALIHIGTSAQIVTVKGQVTDERQRLPVPYVTIGVKDKPVGTNAGEDGKFNLTIDLKSIGYNEEIIFSCIGYKSRSIQLNELIRAFNHIELLPAVTTLNEVVVTQKKIKQKIFGKNTKGGLTHFNIYSRKDSLDDGLSKEFGAILKLNEYCLLKTFSVYLSANNFSRLKCRLNFYSVANDTPDSLIQTSDIRFTIPKNTLGWINVDLEPYRLVIEGLDRIAVTVQLIETAFTDKGKPILTVPVAYPSPFNAMLYREKSQAKWSVNNSANPSIHVTAYCSQ